MKRPLLLSLVLALLAPGCLPARGAHLTLNYYDRRYCIYSDSSHSRLSYNNSVDGGLEPNIAFRQLMCSPTARGSYHTWAYEQLDPTSPDPLVTALMLVDCVATGTCGPVDDAPGGASLSRTADSFRFARDVDPEAVRAALSAVEAPDEVKESFLQRLQACRSHIVSAVAHMNPRLRAVYVDTIERTLDDRRALIADLGPVRQSYDAVRPAMDAVLLNGSFNEDLHARVRAIRDAAVLTCTSGGQRSASICANGPISHVLTDFLVRSAAGLERPTEAVAEQAILSDMRDTTDPRYAIHFAVGEAMARETTMARDYAAASSRLAASAPAERERLLSEQFGSPPPVDLGQWDNAVGLSPPASPRIVSSVNGLSRFEGRVVRSRHRGRSAVIDVEGVGPRYDRAGTSTYSVPWDEGEHLAAGHWVALTTQGEDARVVIVRADGAADGPYVQVRTAYLGE